MAPFDRLARWMAARVRNLHLALGSYLLAALAVSLAILSLIALFVRVLPRAVLQRFDDNAVAWARGLDSPLLDLVALVGAALGSSVMVWAVLLIGTTVFWRIRSYYSVAVLWLALGGARILNSQLKFWLARPRPGGDRAEIELLAWRFAFPESYSFPSGHAIASAVIFFTVAYLAARLEPSRWQRRSTLITAAVVVVLIGFSRVYIGVHYPSDVLAGFIVGFVWATFSSLSIHLVDAFRRRRRGEPREDSIAP